MTASAGCPGLGSRSRRILACPDSEPQNWLCLLIEIVLRTVACDLVLCDPSIEQFSFLEDLLLTIGDLAAFEIMAEPDRSSSDSDFVAQLTSCQLPLLLYIRSLLPGDAAAGDVAQQANACIWSKRGDFEPGTNFTAWAFSIARFEVLNYRKQQARDTRLVFSDELAETIAIEIPSSKAPIERRHEALRQCLAKLREADRKLILHRYTNSGTLAEYAESVNRSTGGLKVTLYRIRSTLLECIQRTLRSTEAST